MVLVTCSILTCTHGSAHGSAHCWCAVEHVAPLIVEVTRPPESDSVHAASANGQLSNASSVAGGSAIQQLVGALGVQEQELGNQEAELEVLRDALVASNKENEDLLARVSALTERGCFGGLCGGTGDFWSTAETGYVFLLP